ncbi:flavodoxin domain-containing protein [Halomicroarcula sp. GCM10025709]|uniref:flavodoxin domain-containing protein n=1 Tax=Haloarcula TaxID=2237 RepID=UPI0024C4587A|nr:flavodoxin domain-containing protein [Halomicroarcula sp. YJ-61-S]
MVTFAIVYGTGEGQTAKVATRIGTALRDRGHEAVVTDITDADPATVLDGVDAALVGSSIHVGKHAGAIRSFVEANRDRLRSLPTAFFQVSLTSAVDDEQHRAEAARYVTEFTDGTGWHPDRVGLFGGALRYSEYGFLKRLLMKRIAADATGDTDTAQDYEYTDWDEVEQFAADVAAFVEGRLGTTPPADE